MRSLFSTLLFALFLIPVGLVSSASERFLLIADESPAQGNELAKSKNAGLFQRIVVLGASVSAGFTATEPFGGKTTASYRFANFLDAAIAGAHDAVTTYAKPLLFLKPKESLETLVASTVTRKPSLVIALDALFWFCYGDGLTEEQRILRFEDGLKLLAPIDAPLIVGDIPDASMAVGKILSKGEVPSLPTIAECNSRLRKWASTRKNVRLFPVADVLAQSGKNLALTLPGITVPEGDTARLLQQDSLHPSRHGLAILAIAALHRARDDDDGRPREGAVSIVADPAAVYESALKLLESRTE